MATKAAGRSKQALTGGGTDGKGGGRLPFGIMRHDVDELSPASALYYYEVRQRSQEADPAHCRLVCV